MKKTKILAMLFLLTLATIGTVRSQLQYQPSCQYVDVLDGWNESFDSLWQPQSYCEIQNISSFYVYKQVVYYSNIDMYGTAGNPTLWKDDIGISVQGNIRTVEITFDYYVPSYNDVCIPNLIYNGVYTSPQIVLLTNVESDLSSTGTFNDAHYFMNDEIVCDQWNTFRHTVQDFTNSWGSSFSAQSKTIGSMGFEVKNMYVKNITVGGIEIY